MSLRWCCTTMHLTLQRCMAAAMLFFFSSYCRMPRDGHCFHRSFKAETSLPLQNTISMPKSIKRPTEAVPYSHLECLVEGLPWVSCATLAAFLLPFLSCCHWSICSRRRVIISAASNVLLADASKTLSKCLGDFCGGGVGISSVPSSFLGRYSALVKFFSNSINSSSQSRRFFLGSQVSSLGPKFFHLIRYSSIFFLPWRRIRYFNIFSTS